MQPLAEVLGLKDIDLHQLLKAGLAEFLGAAILVTLGCGAAETCRESNDVIPVALTFGLTLTFIVQTFGVVSGGHVNPAVTLGFLLTGGVSLVKCLVYVSLQVLGAVVGAGVVWLTVPVERRGNIGTTTLGEGVHLWQGLLVETVSTLLLVTVVLASSDHVRRQTTDDGRRTGPSPATTIGVCVVAVATWSGPLTGGSMNPARSFGPAVWSGVWRDHWVYWSAPCIGSTLAAFFCVWMFVDKPRDTHPASPSLSGNPKVDYSRVLGGQGRTDRKVSDVSSASSLGIRAWRRHSWNLPELGAGQSSGAGTDLGLIERSRSSDTNPGSRSPASFWGSEDIEQKREQMKESDVDTK